MPWLKSTVIPRPSFVREDAASVALIGLGTAVPPFRLSQKDSLDYILKNFRVREGTKALYRRVFRNESIEFRHFAFDDPSEVLEKDHDRVNARYEKWAVPLSAESLAAALGRAGVAPRDLDALVVTTCTGYLCPGLSAYLVEAAGLRPSVHCADLVGMGCGAALPALRQAHDFVSARPGATAAVVCTEICSAAMYSDDAPDLVISNALFGDGSAAAILSSSPRVFGGDPGRGQTGTVSPRFRDFASLVIPEWRDDLRFRTEKGFLRNVLGKEVPRQAAEAVRRLVLPLLESQGLRAEDLSRWILHAGGEKVLLALRDALAVPAERLEASRSVLKNFGNMSSPTVLFVLAEEMARRPPRPGERAVMASFGAGFSAHAALLEF